MCMYVKSIFHNYGAVVPVVINMDTEREKIDGRPLSLNSFPFAKNDDLRLVIPSIGEQASSQTIGYDLHVVYTQILIG